MTFNLLFAGHDTTAATLTLMLRYLKQEPAVLQKLRDEQKQVSCQHIENQTRYQCCLLLQLEWDHLECLVAHESKSHDTLGSLVKAGALEILSHAVQAWRLHTDGLHIKITPHKFCSQNSKERHPAVPVDPASIAILGAWYHCYS